MSDAATYTPRGRISKSKLAKMFNFCTSDLGTFLNKEIFAEIEPLGYRKKSKFVSAKIVQVVIDKLGEPEIK